MRGDIPSAALRLLAQLPHRTHEAKRGPERGETMRYAYAYGKPKVATKPAKIITGNGRGGANRVPVILQGVEYRSIRDLRRSLRVGAAKIAQWQADGSLTLANIVRFK